MVGGVVWLEGWWLEGWWLEGWWLEGWWLEGLVVGGVVVGGVVVGGVVMAADGGWGWCGWRRRFGRPVPSMPALAEGRVAPAGAVATC